MMISWLSALVTPLRRDSGLAGVYGRQLPHADARPAERYFLDFLYGSEPREQSADGPAELSMETTLFSNVNSAMPRGLWERFPFAEDIVMSEDQEWSVRVLLAGLRLRYVPEARVRHSHIYTLRSAFRRFFDSGRRRRGPTSPVPAKPIACCGGRPSPTAAGRSPGSSVTASLPRCPIPPSTS